METKAKQTIIEKPNTPQTDVFVQDYRILLKPSSFRYTPFETIPILNLAEYLGNVLLKTFHQEPVA
jgi:hypothetical protein